MNSMPIASKKCPIFILRCLLGGHFHKSRIALFALVAFAVVLVTNSAVAQQGFVLIGGWETTMPATAKSSQTTVTQFFNRDGTFQVQLTMDPFKGHRGGVKKYWGWYKATSASSIAFRVKGWQLCGGDLKACLNCPGNQLACKDAKDDGLEPGGEHQWSFTAHGSNEIVGQAGLVWHRIR